MLRVYTWKPSCVHAVLRPLHVRPAWRGVQTDSARLLNLLTQSWNTSLPNASALLHTCVSPLMTSQHQVTHPKVPLSEL